VCDGLDNDCDGSQDPENSLGCTSFFHDGDGDGFGLTGDVRCLCKADGFYDVTLAGDCADDDAAVNPTVAESCNGKDDDCDEQVDPPDTPGCSVFYKDVDEDGYGESGDSRCLCDSEQPYTANASGDCNDDDESSYPEAPELCDGKDNNCNGAKDEGYLNHDNDGYADCVDIDDDSDGVPDEEDNCQFNSNPTQQNFDDDEMGNACDDDDDNDGDPDVADCAPANPAVGPSKAETCDGIDNNCNGQFDEGFEDTDSDGTKNCLDVDDDNDADPDLSDCKPLDETIHHMAPEVCDGQDNNCDGGIDDDLDVACDDGNPCTDDSCAGGLGCSYLPNTVACDDGDDWCSLDDTCSGGQCVGVPPDCDDGKPCTADECVEGVGCSVTNTCGDENECTQNVCTVGGCEYPAEDDGSPCGTFPNEECVGGQCSCSPGCQGKQCGPDGCGGSCGECPEDDQGCQEGLCFIPAHVWSTGFGAVGSDHIWEAKTDDDGNLFVVGQYQGDGLEVGFDELDPFGNIDIFIVSFDAEGEVRYADSFGGKDQDIARAIAVDPYGGICIVGGFKSPSISFGGGDGLINESSSSLYADIFLERRCGMGSHEWTRGFGGTHDETAWSVAIDSELNVLVAGSYKSWNLDLGGGNLSYSGGEGGFVAKLDPDGEYLWAKSLSGNGADTAYSVGVDADDNVYVAGTFHSTNLDLGGGNLPYHGDHDIFLLKLDEDGEYVWSGSYGGSEQDGYTDLTAIVDPAGNVYVTSYLKSTVVDFGGGVLEGLDGQDAFILKVDADGNHVWSQSLGDVIGSWGDALDVDADGYVYVAGRAHNQKTSTEVVRLTPDGTRDWHRRFDGAQSDEVTAVAVTASGHFYLTGRYQSKDLSLGGDILPDPGNLPHYDVFVGYFSQ